MTLRRSASSRCPASVWLLCCASLSLATSCATGDAVNDNLPPGAEAGLDSSEPDTSTGDASDTDADDASVQEDGSQTDGPPTDAGTDAAPDASCPTGTKLCGGSCVQDDDPVTGCASSSCDPCAFPHGTAACTAGECALATCDPVYADCNTNPTDGCEVELQTDTTNCGTCGNYCSMPSATASCSAGVCEIASCNVGFDNCDPSVANGCETNLQLDPSHCGVCNNLCQPVGYAACNNGVCQATGCPAGAGDCDGDPDTACETNVNTNLAHCGFCGNACVLPHATPECANGKCAVDTCDTGYADCDAEPADGCEVDLKTSTANCGSCSAPCSNTNNTSRTCEDGKCEYLCSPGFADCNGPQAGNVDDGCETVTSGDVNNCGGCGIQCTNLHGATQCFLGVCTPTCAAGYENCDGLPNNGCETAVKGTDVNNCGACGIKCTNAHGGTACAAGVCTPTCATGFANCDNPIDGCETNIAGSVTDCGGCGITCANPHGTTQCTNGLCAPTCSTGFGNCNNNLLDGCETTTSLDPSNCGTCGTICQPVGGSACVNSACQATACPTGTGDCDGIPANGCETNLLTSVANCGACNNGCVLANATAGCTAGKCTVATCTAGYANCDGLDGNGCEIDTRATTAHCGACSAPCSTANNTSRACTSSLCSYVCSTGFADCNGPQNGSSDDGCETSTSMDVNNCGGCAIHCTNANGGVACSASKCAPTCSQGFGDCNTNPNDGCETATTTNASHCGSCGNTCTNQHGTTSCVSAACLPVCSTGWASCNNDPDDGCEMNVSADLNNCGACGVKCTNAHGTTSCTGSACAPVCTTGYDDCDGLSSNGCEANVSSDPWNCGSCGNACEADNAVTTCSTGTCTIVGCQPYYYDVDKNPANGCEYLCQYSAPTAETCDGTDQDCDGQVDEGFDKLSDPNNCGTCGNVCNPGGVGLCCSGTCRASSTTDCGSCGHACTAGMLVINELQIAPTLVTDALGEWFEVYNPNSYDVDIRGFVITDLNPTPDSHTITSSTPVIVPALGYAVLGKNANTQTNGGVTIVYQYSNYNLGNSGDEVIISAHGTQLDKVAWPTSSFQVANKSKELSITHRTATQNDTLTNWCTATQTYYASPPPPAQATAWLWGTPGASNSCP